VNWFAPMGWIYRPTHVVGWIISAVTLTACIFAFVAVDRNSHSASDTLIGVFPYAVLFVIIWGWIASKSSKR